MHFNTKSYSTDLFGYCLLTFVRACKACWKTTLSADTTRRMTPAPTFAPRLVLGAESKAGELCAFAPRTAAGRSGSIEFPSQRRCAARGACQAFRCVVLRSWSCSQPGSSRSCRPCCYSGALHSPHESLRVRVQIDGGLCAFAKVRHPGTWPGV